ncbi:putative C6 zinc finger domain containing protein [Seiridium cardinale]
MPLCDLLGTSNDARDPISLQMLVGDGIPAQMHQKLGTLARLQPKDPVAQHNIRLIVNSMRAYPYMMLRRETFPPFIHPQWHRQNPPTLPWPLANCMGIASLFVSRTTETKLLLWETVRSESQRCLDEMVDMSEECFLGAIQVQVMYLIMRVVDGETHPDPLNLQLLATFKVLCQQFKALNDGNFFPCRSSDWESWIHTESRVRILVVFFLISRVISIFTGLNCPIVDLYRELPICSTRGPWEAKTDTEWQLELAACAYAKDDGLSTIGHMIDLGKADGEHSHSHMLDSWNATADNLGILLQSVTLTIAHA